MKQTVKALTMTGNDDDWWQFTTECNSHLPESSSHRVMCLQNTTQTNTHTHDDDDDVTHTQHTFAHLVFRKQPAGMWCYHSFFNLLLTHRHSPPLPRPQLCCNVHKNMSRISALPQNYFHDIPNQRHRTYILHWQIICNDAAPQQIKIKDRPK